MKKILNAGKHFPYEDKDLEWSNPLLGYEIYRGGTWIIAAVLCDGDSGRKIELRKWTRKNKKEPWYPKRAKSYGINSKNQLEMTIKALQNLLPDM